MKKKFLALITSLMLMVGLFGVMPMTVNAATNTTLDISNGNIVFTSSGVTQNGIAVAVADSYTIIGTSNLRTVSVTSGTHNITLQNATIAANGMESAFSITGGTVNLTLEGSNTLSHTTCVPGLQVSNVATLNILSSSTGSLTANGGGFSAGIGGNSDGAGGSGGNITIDGGTINANGGAQAAGIGGGSGAGSGGGNITINGGTVNATGGDAAAGIGNGKNCAIKITGGTVNATGGNYAAGIGSGRAGKDNHVEISGGTVNAIGGSGSASIGNGCNNGTILSTGATIKITGGSVRASSMSSVAPPSNGSTPVYLTTITLPSSIPANSSCVVKVDNLDFNVPNTHSDGKIYLYLTAIKHTVSLIYNAKTCSATSTILANDNNVMTLVYAPTVSSVTVPANASYKAGTKLDFTVTYDAAVDVTGSPSLPITLNIGGTVQATYVSGSGTAALVFRYTIVAGNTDTDGISVGSSLFLNGGTIKSTDDGTINAILTLNGVGSTTGVLVDTTAPVITGVNNGETYTTSKSPTFNEGVATLRKDAGTTEPYISGTAIPASGTYVLTVTDLAGNITIVNFTISIPTKPGAPTTAAPTTEPKIGGTSGWTKIEEKILSANAGETLNIDMNGTTNVPQSILSDIKGKDVTVVFDMGTYSWAINGKDITSAQSVDLGATYTPNVISPDLVDGVAGDSTFIQFQLNYSGSFGFTGKLTIHLPVEKAGQYANLYYYNPETKKLEIVASALIQKDGTATFNFSHASDYVVVMEKTPKSGDLAAGASITDNAKPITENGMPYAVIAAVLAVGMVAFKQKKAKK